MGAPAADPAIPADPAADPDAPAVEETVTMPRAESDALRRSLAEAERKANKLEADRKKAAEEQAAEQGRWQELAQQREQELAEARSTTERVAAEARITRLATKAKFIDPADVIGKVKPDEATDDAAIEAALEKIATQSPHLVAKEAPAVPEIGQVLTPSAPGVPGAPAAQADGKPNPPTGKQPLQSLDQWEALPQAERGERMAEADWLYLNEPK